MVNKVILIGNLGADPETRTTNSGSMVCNLRIATNERQKDRDGNWSDHTEWHRVVCFGRTAENVGRFLRKGRQIFIEGRIQTQKWQDRDGRDRYTTEIVANQIRFLGGRDGGAGGGGGGGGGGYQGGGGGGYQGGGGQQGGGGHQGGDGGYSGGGDAPSGPAPAQGGGGAPDDDIPF